MRASAARCPMTPAWLDRIEEPLTKFVFSYVRDRHATEDVVQEVFLKAFRNLDRYRGRASLKTWVFSIARNLCLDTLRSSRRARLRRVEAPDPDSSGADPRAQLELTESRDQVRKALNELSPEAQMYLVLRICHGLSHREIARHCGVKPTGVGVRISRALQGLSRRLPPRHLTFS